MSLISFEFFAFSALALLLYAVFPKRARWGVLCAVSLLFYLASGVYSLLCVVAISLISYAFALCLEKSRLQGRKSARKTLLSAGVAVIVAAWLSTKYFTNGTLPLGISFFSLRAISYLFEVGRGRERAQKNFFKFLLFIAWFPAALLGPVTSYGEISDSLYSGRLATTEESVSGLLRVAWGIFKKVVIANALVSPLSKIAAESQTYTGAYLLFLLIFYSAQIYCDFSGGIDIALGVSALFGVALPENFDRPFSSTSLREFWNRWHITLGEWFERYVFYPLSLSKPMQRLSRAARAHLGVGVGKKIPVYIATMVTWLLTGLWHGASINFVVWGLTNGTLVLLSQGMSPAFEKFYERHPKLKEKRAALDCLARVRVFFVIGAVRLLDLYRSPLTLLGLLGSVFSDGESYVRLPSEIFTLISPSTALTVLVSLFAVFLVGKRKIKASEIAKKPCLAAACVFLLLGASAVLGTYGEGFNSGDFIYSQY
ncbi:MAG: MBOAT family O-acyltransferase [Eubacteriales bacterium]